MTSCLLWVGLSWALRAHRLGVFSLQSAMPKSKASKLQGSDWVKETKERLDKTMGQFDQYHEVEQPGVSAWEKASTQPLAELREAQPQRSYLPKARSGQETNELLYRASHEGLARSGYNPWKHTTMVAGRPVQVGFAMLALDCSCEG